MKKNAIISGITTLVICLIVFISYDITYCLNDDMMLGSIMDGSYAGKNSAMTYYMATPLAFVISLLYRLIPMLPWLGMFFVGCYICSLFLIIRRVLEYREERNKRAYLLFIGVLVFIAALLNNMVLIHYTVVAAVVGATGVFLLLTLKAEVKAKSIILPAVLIILSYLIRSKVFFMLVPFVAVVMVLRCIEDGIKPWIKALIGYLGLLVILIIINKISFMSKDYREYVGYNDDRTKLYDYVGVRDDAEALDYYKTSGISNQDISLYRSYNVMLTNKDGKAIAQMSRYDGGNEGTVRRVKNAIIRYKEILGERDNYSGLMVLALGLYIIIVCLAIKNKRYRYAIFTVIVFVIRSLLYVYLIYGGRYPERVTVAIMLMELSVNCGLLLRLSNYEQSFSLARLMPMFIMLLALYTSYMSLTELGEDYENVQSVNTTDDVVYSYMAENSDNYYFLDVYATVYRTEKAIKNYNNSFENYLILGGWMSGHPLTDAKLKKMGYEDARDAILTGDNTYLILRDGVGASIEDFEGWLDETFAEIEVLEAEGSIFRIYKHE